MKKAISILFVMVMVVSALALVGCGDEGETPSADSPYVGTWKAVKAEFKGEEASMEDVTEGEEYIMELKADGTAIVTSDTEATGTWTEKSDGIHVKAGDTDTDFKATDDGNLTIELFGAVVTFEKQ